MRSWHWIGILSGHSAARRDTSPDPTGMAPGLGSLRQGSGVWRMIAFGLKQKNGQMARPGCESTLQCPTWRTVTARQPSRHNLDPTAVPQNPEAATNVGRGYPWWKLENRSGRSGSHGLAYTGSRTNPMRLQLSPFSSWRPPSAGRPLSNPGIKRLATALRVGIMRVMAVAYTASTRDV